MIMNAGPLMIMNTMLKIKLFLKKEEKEKRDR